jgi:hypothetical protein
MIIYEVSEDHLKYKRRTLRNTVREEERLLSLHKLKDKFEGRESGRRSTRCTTRP